MPFDLPDNDVAFNKNQSIWMSTDIDILSSGLNGAGVVTGCAVTAQGSPNMTVAIQAGTIRTAGGAIVDVTAGNGTITTAHASNPRIDLVSVSNVGVKTVTAGTALQSPKPPDLPSGHIGLALVYIPANDTTIAGNQITDKRVVLSNITVGRGNTFPSTPVDEDMFYRKDFSMWFRYSDDIPGWICVCPHFMSISGGADITFPYSGTTAVTAGRCPLSSVYGIVVEQIDVSCYVNGTSDASNYWQVHVQTVDGSTVTIMAPFDTQTVTSNNWLRQEYNPGFPIAVADGEDVVECTISGKVGSPGPLYVTAAMNFRILL